jgi:hypothetical protein
MNQQAEQLKARAAEFARRVIALAEKLPPSQAGRRISGQLIDAATSMSAN